MAGHSQQHSARRWSLFKPAANHIPNALVNHIITRFAAAAQAAVEAAVRRHHAESRF